MKISMPTEAYPNLKQLDLPRCFVSVHHNLEMGRKLDIYIPLFSTISGVPTTVRYLPLSLWDRDKCLRVVGILVMVE